MNELDQLTKLAMELQSIAQNGLTYTKDKFDKERFERVTEISAEIMSIKTGFPVEKVKDLFCNETGLKVEPVKIIAIQDRNKHNFPKYAYGICKVFVLCSEIGGSFSQNIETTESEYFSLEHLPELDEEKNVYAQVKMCFDAYKDENWEVVFD